MNTQDLEIKKLRGTVEKLTADKKLLEDKSEYQEESLQEKDRTIYQLNQDLDKIKNDGRDVTENLSAALKEVEDLKNKVEEQVKLVIEKDGELSKTVKEHNDAIVKFKRDFDDGRLKSQGALDGQKRETEEWKHELEVCGDLLKSKEREISNLLAQAQDLQDQSEADIGLLKTCLAEQLGKHKEAAKDFRTEIEDLKEQLVYAKETNENFASKLDYQKILFKELDEKQERIIGEKKSEIARLNHELSKAEDLNAQKDRTVRELESTIKENRNHLYTDSELDLVLAKIKTLRSENKNLKLENLKLLEDNDKLTDDIVCLRKDLEDSASERDSSDLARQNRRLMEINDSLEEEKERLLMQLASRSFSFN